MLGVAQNTPKEKLPAWKVITSQKKLGPASGGVQEYRSSPAALPGVSQHGEAPSASCPSYLAVLLLVPLYAPIKAKGPGLKPLQEQLCWIKNVEDVLT